MEHTNTHNAKKLLMFAGTGFLIVLSIFAIISSIYLMDTKDANLENTISVTGMAEVNAVPDVATFTFSVQDTAKTTAEAQEVISEKVAGILGGLEEIGIPEEDIKTESYSMYPKYEYAKVAPMTTDIAVDGTVYYPGNDRRQVQVGFDVRQQVSVTLHDFDKVATVLTLLGETGVQDLQGPNFQIDEPEELQEQARKEAIDNAKAKAQRLAEDLGVRLDDIVSFNENGGYQPYYAKMESQVSMDSAAGNYAPELPTGENTITANVTITYSIK